MEHYIHYFETETEFNNQYNNNYYEPWLSVINNGNVSYNKSEYQQLLETPLTFEIIGDGNIY